MWTAVCISPVKLVMHASAFPGSTPQSPSGGKCPEPLFLRSILIRFLNHLHWLHLMWRNSDCIPVFLYVVCVFILWSLLTTWGEFRNQAPIGWGLGMKWSSVSANNQKSGPEPVCTQQHVLICGGATWTYSKANPIYHEQHCAVSFISLLLVHVFCSSVDAKSSLEAVSTSCTWRRVTSH